MAELRENATAPPVGARSAGAADVPLSETGELPHDRTDLRSVIEDIEALVDGGRTYLDAELSYQKTRASFVADRLKKAVVYGIIAAVLGLLAAIGLTVGLIIALTPLVTGWGATAIVVGVLLLVAFLLIRRAAGSWGAIQQAMRDSSSAAATQERG